MKGVFMDYLRDLIINLLGPYEPVMYYDSVQMSYVIPPGFSGVDWPWVASAALLILLIYSVFKLFRGLISR